MKFENCPACDWEWKWHTKGMGQCKIIAIRSFDTNNEIKFVCRSWQTHRVVWSIENETSVFEQNTGLEIQRLNYWLPFDISEEQLKVYLTFY